MNKPQSNSPTNEEIATDTVLKWTSDKAVSIKMHGGITTGNDILLVDCIKEALDSKDLAHQEEVRGLKAEIERQKQVRMNNDDVLDSIKEMAKLEIEEEKVNGNGHPTT